MSDDTAWLDATGQAELVRTKEVTPSELVDAAIARIERLNPELNAVIHDLFERARAEAAGELPDGPFRGVPFLLKDLGAELAGTPFCEGLAFAGDYHSTTTQALTQRYIDAGFVICGKTNTPEFGILPTTEPQRFGPSRNPWNTEPLDRRVLRWFGGRGGLGHGARRARQRRGRLHPDSRLVLRPGRAEADAGAQLGCPRLRRHDGRSGGRARRDALGARLGGHPRLHGRSRSRRSRTGRRRCAVPRSRRPPPRAPQGLRVAVMTASPTGSPVHADCVAAVQATAALCESLGHRVEEATLSVDGDAFTAHFVNQWACANAWAIADWEGRLGRSVAEEDLEPLSWALVSLGRAIDGGTYLRSVQELQRISRQIAEYFEGIDVLLTPTLAEPPAPLGTFDSPPGEPLTGLFRAASYVPFTPPFNVTGQPGISLPLHWNEAGLPIGVQFVGRFGDEETLLSLAGQLEEAAPWSGRRPPVAA